jgi:hypothetical protein
MARDASGELSGGSCSIIALGIALCPWGISFGKSSGFRVAKTSNIEPRIALPRVAEIIHVGQEELNVVGGAARVTWLKNTTGKN